MVDKMDDELERNYEENAEEEEKRKKIFLLVGILLLIFLLGMGLALLSPGVELSPPTNIKAHATSSSVTLSWDAVNEATAYRIYRSTNGQDYLILAETGETQYTDTSVKEGATYFYKITSLREDTESAPSSPVEVKVPWQTPSFSAKLAKACFNTPIISLIISSENAEACRVSTDMERWSEWMPVGEVNVSLSDLKVGQNTLFVQCKRGNATSDVEELTLNYDDISPTMIIYSLHGVNNTLTIDLEASDNTGAVNCALLNLDTNESVANKTVEGRETFTIEGVDKDSSYALLCYDSCGNPAMQVLPDLRSVFEEENATPNVTVEMVINNDAPSTTTREVTLNVNTRGVRRCRFTNDVDYPGSWSAWITAPNGEWTYAWTLSEGEGRKRVYMQCKVGATEIVEVWDDIIYNSTSSGGGGGGGSGGGGGGGGSLSASVDVKGKVRRIASILMGTPDFSEMDSDEYTYTPYLTVDYSSTGATGGKLFHQVLLGSVWMPGLYNLGACPGTEPPSYSSSYASPGGTVSCRVTEKIVVCLPFPPHCMPLIPDGPRKVIYKVTNGLVELESEDVITLDMTEPSVWDVSCSLIYTGNESEFTSRDSIYSLTCHWKTSDNNDLEGAKSALSYCLSDSQKESECYAWGSKTNFDTISASSSDRGSVDVPLILRPSDDGKYILVKLYIGDMAGNFKVVNTSVKIDLSSPSFPPAEITGVSVEYNTSTAETVRIWARNVDKCKVEFVPTTPGSELLSCMDRVPTLDPDTMSAFTPPFKMYGTPKPTADGYWALCAFCVNSSVFSPYLTYSYDAEVADTLLIDTTPPTISRFDVYWVNFRFPPITDVHFNIIWSASDSLSGISTVKLYRRERSIIHIEDPIPRDLPIITPWTEITEWTIHDKEGNATYSDYGVVIGKDYQYRLVVIDEQGNSAEMTSEWKKAKEWPPTE